MKGTQEEYEAARELLGALEVSKRLPEESKSRLALANATMLRLLLRSRLIPLKATDQSWKQKVRASMTEPRLFYREVMGPCVGFFNSVGQDSVELVLIANNDDKARYTIDATNQGSLKFFFVHLHELIPTTGLKWQ